MSITRMGEYEFDNDDIEDLLAKLKEVAKKCNPDKPSRAKNLSEAMGSDSSDKFKTTDQLKAFIKFISEADDDKYQQLFEANKETIAIIDKAIPLYEQHLKDKYQVDEVIKALKTQPLNAEKSFTDTARQVEAGFDQISKTIKYTAQKINELAKQDKEQKERMQAIALEMVKITLGIFNASVGAAIVLGISTIIQHANVKNLNDVISAISEASGGLATTAPISALATVTEGTLAEKHTEATKAALDKLVHIIGDEIDDKFFQKWEKLFTELATQTERRLVALDKAISVEKTEAELTKMATDAIAQVDISMVEPASIPTRAQQLGHELAKNIRKEKTQKVERAIESLSTCEAQAQAIATAPKAHRDKLINEVDTFMGYLINAKILGHRYDTAKCHQQGFQHPQRGHIETHPGYTFMEARAKDTKARHFPNALVELGPAFLNQLEIKAPGQRHGMSKPKEDLATFLAQVLPESHADKKHKKKDKRELLANFGFKVKTGGKKKEFEIADKERVRDTMRAVKNIVAIFGKTPPPIPTLKDPKDIAAAVILTMQADVFSHHAKYSDPKLPAISPLYVLMNSKLATTTVDLPEVKKEIIKQLGGNPSPRVLQMLTDFEATSEHDHKRLKHATDNIVTMLAKIGYEDKIVQSIKYRAQEYVDHQCHEHKQRNDVNETGNKLLKTDWGLSENFKSHSKDLNSDDIDTRKKAIDALLKDATKDPASPEYSSRERQAFISALTALQTTTNALIHTRKDIEQALPAQKFETTAAGVKLGQLADSAPVPLPERKLFHSRTQHPTPLDSPASPTQSDPHSSPTAPAVSIPPVSPTLSSPGSSPKASPQSVRFTATPGLAGHSMFHHQTDPDASSEASPKDKPAAIPDQQRTGKR